MDTNEILILLDNSTWENETNFYWFLNDQIYVDGELIDRYGIGGIGESKYMGFGENRLIINSVTENEITLQQGTMEPFTMSKTDSLLTETRKQLINEEVPIHLKTLEILLNEKYGRDFTNQEFRDLVVEEQNALIDNYVTLWAVKPRIDEENDIIKLEISKIYDRLKEEISLIVSSLFDNTYP